MTAVHFIGAGPGAPDLLTIRAQRLIASCPLCLYAGSLVPHEVLEHCPPGARLLDTQHLELDHIIAEMQAAYDRGEEVARLHSGDPSIYSAAALKRELTIPGVAQTVILARHGRRASPIPAGEELGSLAQHGATLVVHLGAQAIDEIVAALVPSYGSDCPVAVVARASWPEEIVLRGTLADIGATMREAGIRRTATILFGPALAAKGFRDSHLYSATRERPAAAQR